MTEAEQIYEAVKTNPRDRAAWHALADVMDANGKPNASELMRMFADGKKSDWHGRQPFVKVEADKSDASYRPGVFGIVSGIPMHIVVGDGGYVEMNHNNKGKNLGRRYVRKSWETGVAWVPKKLADGLLSEFDSQEIDSVKLERHGSPIRLAMPEDHEAAPEKMSRLRKAIRMAKPRKSLHDAILSAVGPQFGFTHDTLARMDPKFVQELATKLGITPQPADQPPTATAHNPAAAPTPVQRRGNSLRSAIRKKNNLPEPPFAIPVSPSTLDHPAIGWTPPPIPMPVHPSSLPKALPIAQRVATPVASPMALPVAQHAPPSLPWEREGPPAPRMGKFEGVVPSPRTRRMQTPIDVAKRGDMYHPIGRMVSHEPDEPLDMRQHGDMWLPIAKRLSKRDRLRQAIRMSRGLPVRFSADTIGIHRHLIGSPMDKSAWAAMSDALREEGHDAAADAAHLIVNRGEPFWKFDFGTRNYLAAKEHDGLDPGWKAHDGYLPVKFGDVPAILSRDVSRGDTWHAQFGDGKPYSSRILAEIVTSDGFGRRLLHEATESSRPDLLEHLRMQYPLTPEPEKLRRPGSANKFGRHDSREIYRHILENPHDATGWGALADSFDEDGKHTLAMATRLFATHPRNEQFELGANLATWISPDIDPIEHPWSGGFGKSVNGGLAHDIPVTIHYHAPLFSKPFVRVKFNYDTRRNDGGLCRSCVGVSVVPGEHFEQLIGDLDSFRHGEYVHPPEPPAAQAQGKRLRFNRPLMMHVAQIERGPSRMGRSTRLRNAIRMARHPVRNYALKDRPVSIQGATTRINSSNHASLLSAMRSVLTRSGLTPHRVYPAIHDFAGDARASLIAEVFGERRTGSANYGAAWQGLVAKQPSLVVFRSHPQGQDSVYKIPFKGPQHVMSQLLDQIGVTNRVYVPHKEGSHVYLYDQGRKLRDSVGSLAASMGLTAIEHLGQGSSVGGGDDMGRDQYRQEIARAEQAPIRQSRVRLGREDNPHIFESVKADPHDDAPWLVLADSLDESGKPHTAELMRSIAATGQRDGNSNKSHGYAAHRHLDLAIPIDWSTEPPPSLEAFKHVGHIAGIPVAIRQGNPRYSCIVFHHGPLGNYVSNTLDNAYSPAVAYLFPNHASRIISELDDPVTHRLERDAQPIRCTRLRRAIRNLRESNPVRLGRMKNSPDVQAMLAALRENPNDPSVLAATIDALEAQGRTHEADFLRGENGYRYFGDRFHVHPPHPSNEDYRLDREFYKEIAGRGTTHPFWASAATPEEVLHVLADFSRHREPVHISYGDSETGKDWLEEHGVRGTIGRSGGEMPIPLLIPTSRSMGGGGILTDSIVRIRRYPQGDSFYTHPSYHHGEVQLRQLDTPITHHSIASPTLTPIPLRQPLTHEVLIDGKPHARFRTERAAKMWIKKMGLSPETAKPSQRMSRKSPVKMAHNALAMRLPGKQDHNGDPYHPPAEPDMAEYIRNRFSADFGRSEPHHEPHDGTGYILPDGTPVSMGDSSLRYDDHRAAIPSHEAMVSWGWPQEVTDEYAKHNRQPALEELIRRSRAARVHLSPSIVSVHTNAPMTRAQRDQITTYVMRNKPTYMRVQHMGNVTDLEHPDAFAVEEHLRRLPSRMSMKDRLRQAIRMSRHKNPVKMMNESPAFGAAIEANPDDAAPKLAYADYADDHGYSHLADVIRRANGRHTDQDDSTVDAVHFWSPRHFLPTAYTYGKIGTSAVYSPGNDAYPYVDVQAFRPAYDSPSDGIPQYHIRVGSPKSGHTIARLITRDANLVRGLLGEMSVDTGSGAAVQARARFHAVLDRHMRPDHRPPQQMSRTGKPVKLAMPEDHDALHSSMIANPHDATAHAAYADILDSDGHPHAAEAFRRLGTGDEHSGENWFKKTTHSAGTAHAAHPNLEFWFYVRDEGLSGSLPHVRVCPLIRLPRNPTSPHQFPEYSTSDMDHVLGLLSETSPISDKFPYIDGKAKRSVVDAVHVAKMQHDAQKARYQEWLNRDPEQLSRSQRLRQAIRMSRKPVRNAAEDGPNLLRAAIANPYDSTTHAAFADWLDEQTGGSPIAAHIRDHALGNRSNDYWQFTEGTDQAKGFEKHDPLDPESRPSGIWKMPIGYYHGLDLSAIPTGMGGAEHAPVALFASVRRPGGYPLDTLARTRGTTYGNATYPFSYTLELNPRELKEVAEHLGGTAADNLEHVARSQWHGQNSYEPEPPYEHFVGDPPRSLEGTIAKMLGRNPGLHGLHVSQSNFGGDGSNDRITMSLGPNFDPASVATLLPHAIWHTQAHAWPDEGSRHGLPIVFHYDPPRGKKAALDFVLRQFGFRPNTGRRMRSDLSSMSGPTYIWTPPRYAGGQMRFSKRSQLRTAIRQSQAGVIHPVRMARISIAEAVREAAQQLHPNANTTLSYGLHMGLGMPHLAELLSRAPDSPTLRPSIPLHTTHLYGGDRLPLALTFRMNGENKWQIGVGDTHIPGLRSGHGSIGSYTTDANTAHRIWREFAPHVTGASFQKKSGAERVFGESDHHNVVDALGVDDPTPGARRPDYTPNSQFSDWPVFENQDDIKTRRDINPNGPS